MKLAEALAEMKALADFETSEGQAFTQRLSPSIHAGATASLLEGKARAGLLYYHTLGHGNLMAAGGVSPVEWLNLGVNWTLLGPAGRLGFYAELIPKKYVGLFFGMECASLRRNSAAVPIRNFTESCAFGLNVLFGD